ncbi:MAG: winged helix-turn-helix transcriptional regulator [Thermoplasmatota archaeon]
MPARVNIPAGPLLLLLSLSLFILISAGPSICLIMDEPVNERDPYEQFSTEVLLNADGVAYDISLLDDYVEDGQMRYIDVGYPVLRREEAGEGMEPLTGEPEEEFDFPPGEYYLYASHEVSEIAVILTDVDDTRLAEPFFPDLSLKGLSVSLVVPSKLEVQEVAVKRGKAALDPPLVLNQTVPVYMEERGYLTHPLRDDDWNLIGFGILKGSTEIYIFNGSSKETMWSGLGSGITAIVDADPGTEAVDEDIRGLLEHLGFNSTIWTGSYQDGIREEEVPVEDMEGDMGDLDWELLISAELGWLIEKNIVSGLSDDDIEDISVLAGPGRSGINHRIVHHDGGWKSFEDIGTITILGGGYEDTDPESRYNMARSTLPQPTGLKGSDDDILFIIVIAAISIVFVMIAILIPAFYARHKRSELLNNLNRKHLYDTIKGTPGIHFSELQRELDLKQGVLSYHLNVLEKNEMIKSVQDGTYRRFYLYDEKIEFEFRLHEMQKKILFIISQKPGITQSKISKRLGRNRMVVNYHLKILLETGILHMEREGRETHCYMTDIGYSIASA